MQKLFLVDNGSVILQNETKTYADTLENFILDSKTQAKIKDNVDYNVDCKRYILGGVLQEYPNAVIDAIIANTDSIVENKNIRITPVETFAEAKAKKLQEVNSWTESKITGGFISNCTGENVRYDSDMDTQVTMQGIAINASSLETKYPSGVPVRGYVEGNEEKTIQYLSGEELLLWQADLSLHIGNCKIAGWEKQAEVNTCKTKDDLDKIILD